MTEFDHLIGPAPESPPPRKRGRPSNAEREARAAATLQDLSVQQEIRAAGGGRTKIPVNDFLMPVPQNFLARVLRMDPMTVNKRLRTLQPAGHVGGNRPVYWFHEAIEYLVKPKMDLDSYLQTLHPAHLPNSINKVYWEAKRIKLKYQLEAGEAWATSDVLEVFGEVFMTIKSRTQLWTERMRELGMSDEQASAQDQMVDAYLTDLHEKLVEIPKRRQTSSKITEMDDTGGPLPFDDADDDGDLVG